MFNYIQKKGDKETSQEDSTTGCRPERVMYSNAGGKERIRKRNNNFDISY